MSLSIEGFHAMEALPRVDVPRRPPTENVPARDITLAVEVRNVSTDRTCGDCQVAHAGNGGRIVVSGGGDSIGYRNPVGGALKAQKVTNRLKSFTSCQLTATSETYA